MDTKELISRLRRADEGTVGKLINQFADPYRRGASLRTLIPLLEDSDSRLVSLGAWIASEVADGNRGREIFDELAVLLDHPDSAVRFGVIESIALLATPAEPSVIRRLFLLAVDPNSGVRQQALYWLCHVSESLVEALRDTDLWPGARLLLGGVSGDEIRAASKSEREFDRRMAVAAALRNFGSDESFVQELLPRFDDESATSLSRLRLRMESESGKGVGNP